MDQGTKTRFQRKGVAKIPEVRGTKKSLTNFQLLVGTGVPDLDHILGGGLPVGSLVLIEDLPCKSRNDELFESTEGFSNVLVKYFLGEGVAQRHSLFFGSCDMNGDKFLSDLPEIVLKSQQPSDASSDASFPTDDKMKIAWRYENQKKVVSTTEISSTTASHQFNLQNKINRDMLQQCETVIWSPPPLFDPTVDDFYRDVFERLEFFVEKEAFNLVAPSAPASDSMKNVLRTSIQNFGAVNWCDDVDASKAIRFLFALRSLARHHLMNCLVTISADSRTAIMMKNAAAMSRIRSLCDVVIQLTPFSTDERKKGPFKDYHGVMTLSKVANLNCLRSPHQQNEGAYLFKSTRTKFQIDKMHLPPDASIEVQKNACDSKLDF